MTEEELYKISDKAEERCREMFEWTDAVALFNTKKVLDAFKKHRVSDSCFAGTTGYGYDDAGRLFGALVHQIFAAETACRYALAMFEYFCDGSCTAEAFAFGEGFIGHAVTGFPDTAR